MSLADKFSPAPREVRLAGGLTALPGLVMFALAVALLVNSLTRAEGGTENIYAEVVYYALMGAGTVACAVGLVLGKTWARSPGVVVGLLLAAIGWYAAGPSGQPAIGIPLIAVGVLIVVLLFRVPSRAWALGLTEGESEEDAAWRDSAEGRAARREREENG
ncbi:hypothetical protein [Amycolatopsis palatopharyngis]|uniref:hypothetical protein n=1 Tax=Amycolatopsis palatopharyngis TaxID=187982 RepID=UPI000E21E232|nr:hypothetical protein [Amycolatopsis palatopharyngis]